MISILMPTRQRIDLAKESIQSLGEDNGLFEILLYVDNDDSQIEQYKELAGGHVKVFVGERYGYGQLHEMINFLSHESTGDWLVLWNDDALMLTSDWAEKINTIDASKPVVLNFFDPMNRFNNLFTVISRSMFAAMGHYSLNTHCDSWVQDIANALDIHIPVHGISSVHRRESIHDQTKIETQATYSTTSPAYSGMIQERFEDAEKIKKFL